MSKAFYAAAKEVQGLTVELHAMRDTWNSADDEGPNRHVMFNREKKQRPEDMPDFVHGYISPSFQRRVRHMQGLGPLRNVI